MKMNEKILMCRKRMGLSQEGLAQQLNTSRQAVSKWELGDAQPDLNNVIALAKLFDVTTDWLLMDAEDEPESMPAAEPQPAPQPAQDAPADDWVEHLPRILARMVRRYGWLSGVYAALIGLGNFVIGAIATGISNAMMNSFGNTSGMQFDGFGATGMGGMTLYDEAGAIITDPAIYQALDMTVPTYSSGGSFFNPVAALGTIMMVFGALAIIAGIALALYLRKRFTQ